MRIIDVTLPLAPEAAPAAGRAPRPSILPERPVAIDDGDGREGGTAAVGA